MLTIDRPTDHYSVYIVLAWFRFTRNVFVWSLLRAYDARAPFIFYAIHFVPCSLSAWQSQSAQCKCCRSIGQEQRANDACTTFAHIWCYCFLFIIDAILLLFIVILILSTRLCRFFLLLFHFTFYSLFGGPFLSFIWLVIVFTMRIKRYVQLEWRCLYRKVMVTVARCALFASNWREKNRNRIDYLSPCMAVEKAKQKKIKLIRVIALFRLNFLNCKWKHGSKAVTAAQIRLFESFFSRILLLLSKNKKKTVSIKIIQNELNQICFSSWFLILFFF